MPALWMIVFAARMPGALAQEAAAPPPTSPTPEVEAESLWNRQPNVGYGPFRQAALGFFHSLRPGFTPRVPVSLPEGNVEVRATESWEKVIAEKDQAFNLDYEILRTEASVAYGLSDSACLELDFDTATRVHGILDPLMNGFHDTFAIPLGPRGRLPNNSFRIELAPGQGRPPINLDRDAGRPFTRAVVLTLEEALTYGDDLWPAVAVSFSVRPPMGHFEKLSGGSTIDLSASLSASKTYGEFTLYLAANYSLFGDESFSGTPMRPSQWQGLAALEWRCLEDVSLVLQCLSTGPAVSSFERFSKPAFELCYGFKWEVTPNVRIDFGMLHDLQNPVAAPDFGFQLEVSLRF